LELLDLIHVIEGVLSLEPEQDIALGHIVSNELFLADELPTPTEAEREAPRMEPQQQMGLF
jgi:hypothetical protein